MQSLEKASLSYIRKEDRICLRGQISQQHILFLWLTHRLVRQLVPHLIKSSRWLSGEDGFLCDSAQGQEDSLTERIEPVPKLAGLRDDMLVHEIQLRSSPEYVELTFQSENATDASRIILSLKDAQKLLDGLKFCFEEAVWPCDVWHEDSGADTQLPTSPVTLH